MSADHGHAAASSGTGLFNFQTAMWTFFLMLVLMGPAKDELKLALVVAVAVGFFLKPKSGGGDHH